MNFLPLYMNVKTNGLDIVEDKCQRIIKPSTSVVQTNSSFDAEVVADFACALYS